MMVQRLCSLLLLLLLLLSALRLGGDELFELSEARGDVRVLRARDLVERGPEAAEGLQLREALFELAVLEQRHREVENKQVVLLIQLHRLRRTRKNDGNNEHRVYTGWEQRRRVGLVVQTFR